MSLKYVVVDDAPFIRELIKSVVDSLGHECVGEAGDAFEAMDVLAETLPDFVFVDLVMPKKTGITLAQEIRVGMPDVRLIACTTLEPSELPPGAELHFDAWLGKPFTKNGIAEALEQIFPATRRQAR